MEQPERHDQQGASAGERLISGGLPGKPSYYVGLGASAGGLEALQVFFSHMPPQSGLAFIVVQHLSPDYKSLMVELLSKNTEMEVLRVEDGVPIQPNTVYLIPPKKNMTIHQGNLYLTEKPERHSLNLPIDFFFNSLAEDQGERAIGIILSGTGSDGARGVRAIKEAGGTIMVQDQDSAKFDGMPRSAIATGLADFIVPPEIMPAELLNFINHPRIAEKKEPAEISSSEEDTFGKIFRIINKKTNVDFSQYKPSTMVRRIERRMGIVQVNGFDEYLAYLHRNPKEVTALFKDLLIGVTKFFRDHDAFYVLKDHVIPRIFEQAQTRDMKAVRVWIPGCSTGEEAYTVAMLIRDHIDTIKSHIDVKVFATDIDRGAIEFAGAGLYPESIVADLDSMFLSRYFDKKLNGYQVRRSIREMIVFAVQNLIKDPPFTKVDLITCRNLLIYLQPVLQKRVLSIFNYALISGGFLFLGNSETVGEMHESFQPVDSSQRIYIHPKKGLTPLKNDDIIPLSITRNLSAGQAPVYYSKDTIITQRMVDEEKYYHALIRLLAQAVIIINDERELVQSFGEAGQYLKIPEGDMSLDVLTMLPREISLAVSSAIHKVRKTGETVLYRDIRFKKDDAVISVDLMTNIIREYKGRSLLFVLKITPHQPTLQISEIQSREDLPDDHFMDQRIRVLEQEVQFTRENLQATIEELQTSNEELQATNEELLAANEELQSTNEELQSLNEELNTVNSEYQMKNIELTELNNDIRNLMESTDIGTIFLDKHLSIRRFTPAVSRVVNLLEQDIGRPFTDLSLPLFGDIMADIKQTAASLIPLERRIQDKATYYLLRVLPFKNHQHKFDGIVINLIDITVQALTEKELELKNEVLENILGNSPSAQLMIDSAGTIMFANHRAAGMFGLEREALTNSAADLPELTFTDLDNQPVSFISGPMALIHTNRAAIDKYIMQFHGKNGREIIFSVAGNPLFDAENRIKGAIFKLEELAEK